MLYQDTIEQSNLYLKILRNHGLDKPIDYKISVPEDLRIPEFDYQKTVCRGPFVNRLVYFDQMLSYLSMEDSAILHLYFTPNGIKNDYLEEEILEWCKFLQRCVNVYYALENVIDSNTIKGLVTIYDKVCFKIEHLMNMTDSLRRRNIVDKYPEFFEYAFKENLAADIQESPLTNVFANKFSLAITESPLCIVEEDEDTNVESIEPEELSSWQKHKIEDEYSAHLQEIEETIQI